MNRQEIINTILMTSIFVLVFSAWSICVVLWVVQYARRRKQLHKRLGFGETDLQRTQVLQLWRDEYEARKQAGRSKRLTLGERLEQIRMAAGWKSPWYTVVLAVCGVAGVAGGAALVLGYGAWLAATLAGGVVLVFWVVTKRRMVSRVALFERQFVDALGIAARALRAGHPLVGAFQLVSEEVGDPLGSLFGEICQEQALGLDLESSIRRAANNSRSADLKLFATAVSIQTTSGGNLAELMDTLSEVVRARMRLHRRVRVLTAQTNMSKWILIALPIVIFLALNITAPVYMRPFYTTWTGRYMLIATGTSVLLGAWLMARLSVIRY
jgi:tight adherence protein B